MSCRFSPVVPMVFALMAAISAVQAAETPPLVFAVDAGLEPSAREASDAIVEAISAVLADDAEIGLILFDDVVLNTVPLAVRTTTQLDAFDAALSLRSAVRSANVTVGIDRALNEIGDRDRAHLMMFARLEITGEDTASDARFEEWYRRRLLPDADANDIAITLVAPPSSVDTALLDELERYPANAYYPLEPTAEGAADTRSDTELLARLQRRLTGNGTEGAIPVATDATDAGPETGSPRPPWLPLVLALSVALALWFGWRRHLSTRHTSGAVPATADDENIVRLEDRSGRPTLVPSAWVKRSIGRITEKYRWDGKSPSPDLSPFEPGSLDGPTLVVHIDGEREPMLLPLGDGSTKWVIGSDVHADLRIPHKSVSTYHAVLSREGRKWRLTDELALNKTYVNGKRFHVGYVGEGYRLRFGAAECRLIVPDSGHARDRGKPGQ